MYNLFCRTRGELGHPTTSVGHWECSAKQIVHYFIYRVLCI